MDDLRQRFVALDSTPVPDLWPEVERRAEELGREGARGLTRLDPRWGVARPGLQLAPRRVTVLVAAILAVLLAVGGLLVGAEFQRRQTQTIPTPSTAPATTLPAVETSPSPEA